MSNPMSLMRNTILSHAKKIKINKGGIIYFKDNDSEESLCYMLISGVISMLKRSDNMIVLTFSDDFLLGDVHSVYYSSQYYLEAEVDSEILAIPSKDLSQVFTTQKHWEELTVNNAKILSRFFLRDEILLQDNSYAIIRSLIPIIMVLPDTVRNNCTLSSLIQKRVKISRSNVMRILAHLKANNYITLNKGRLISAKILPDNMKIPLN
ncbi:helix-turn-helix domain-containing protein [Hafnia alvei]|nr:helix-turn-helix domain-containing protein [Hafnia alvei]QQE43807.1 helix-turn-helix domain-containing protein [Hafnia alvei]